MQLITPVWCVQNCSDEVPVLSMSDVMRAICFSPVKGTYVWESACECVRVCLCDS